jgi:hypothetical protein
MFQEAITNLPAHKENANKGQCDLHSEAARVRVWCVRSLEFLGGNKYIRSQIQVKGKLRQPVEDAL